MANDGDAVSVKAASAAIAAVREMLNLALDRIVSLSATVADQQQSIERLQERLKELEAGNEQGHDVRK